MPEKKKPVDPRRGVSSENRPELPCGCIALPPDDPCDALTRAFAPSEGPWPTAHRDPRVHRVAQERLGPLFGPLEGVVHERHSWLVYVEVHLRGPVPEDDYPFVDLHTAGMSQLPMNDPEARSTGLPLHAELTMQFPVEWCEGENLLRIATRPDKVWAVQWLRRLARLPHEQRSYLDIGHVITFPRGEFPGCPFDGAIIAETVVDEHMAVGPYIREDMAAVQLFRVIPLLPPETEYTRRHCGRHLIDKLEQAGAHEPVRVDRGPVV
jgi:hypothetical protein